MIRWRAGSLCRVLPSEQQDRRSRDAQSKQPQAALWVERRVGQPGGRDPTAPEACCTVFSMPDAAPACAGATRASTSPASGAITRPCPKPNTVNGSASRMHAGFRANSPNASSPANCPTQFHTSTRVPKCAVHRAASCNATVKAAASGTAPVCSPAPPSHAASMKHVPAVPCSRFAGRKGIDAVGRRATPSWGWAGSGCGAGICFPGLLSNKAASLLPAKPACYIMENSVADSAGTTGGWQFHWGRAPFGDTVSATSCPNVALHARLVPFRSSCRCLRKPPSLCVSGRNATMGSSTAWKSGPTCSVVPSWSSNGAASARADGVAATRIRIPGRH